MQNVMSHITNRAVSALALLILTCSAHADCTPTGPTMSELGTFVDYNSLCTAISTGASALSAADIDTSTASIDATAIKSYAMQAEQYAKQVLIAQEEVIKTETFLHDLEENPLEVVMPNVNQIIENQKRIDALANQIANDSSSIGHNLMNDLENPSTIGLGQGSRWQLWSDARRATVKEAYDLAKSYLKSQKNDNDLNKTIMDNALGAQGQTATQKAIAAAVAQQLNFLQKMSETLNKILTAQANEDGSRVADEMTAADAQKAAIEQGMGPTLDLETHDSYIGPGTLDSKPF